MKPKSKDRQHLLPFMESPGEVVAAALREGNADAVDAAKRLHMSLLSWHELAGSQHGDHLMHQVSADINELLRVCNRQ